MIDSPTSNKPQVMTNEAMKQTVLTGPSILIFGQISDLRLSSDRSVNCQERVAEHRISKSILSHIS